MNVTAEQLRKRLQLQMTAGGLNQRGLAEQIGVSNQLLNYFMTGHRPPAKAILEYLGMEKVVTVRYRETRKALEGGDSVG